MKLGRYNLLKPLARGGMGEVYLATSGGIEGAERPCVVKLIRREHAQDTSFLARFFDEARIQAQLQHPGVAQVIEAAVDPDGMPFVVLEYVEGKNLGEVRQRSAQLGVTLSWADAVAIAATMAEALCHIHERTDADGKPLCIVHRDLSPQNVMLGYGGDVKLIDFGTARGENRRCQTVAGVVFAKPGYVAPEVANGTPGGAQADIYALGVILWELLMGRKFLIGEPERHIAEVAAGRRAPQPVSLTNNVPLELDAIIEQMTAFDLEKRYPSAREVKTALLQTLKRAPSLADGERGVRPRLAHLMSRLYPSEPSTSRSEFAQLLAAQRNAEPKTLPAQPPAEPGEDDLLPGTRYRLVKELAKSEMSEVWSAQHVDLKRRVAIKLLPKERSRDPKFERRFRSEARTLASLRHPNLVHVHDFGVSVEGRPFYAMELLEGESLRAAMDRRTFSWREATHISVQLLKALSVAHAHGIIHRDVKPENVFLTQTGVAKLLDFGVAQTNDEVEPEANECSRGISLTGTVEYMAPEQAGDEPVDPRADVYGVGAVLYELVTGQRPNAATGVVASLDAKRGVPVSVRKLMPTARIPFALDLALMRALAPAKDDRFADAATMRTALERVALPSSTGGARRVLTWGSVLVLFPLISFAVSRTGVLTADGAEAEPVAKEVAARLAALDAREAEAPSPSGGLDRAVAVEQVALVVAAHETAPVEAEVVVPPPLEPAEMDPDLARELERVRSLLGRGVGQRQRALGLVRTLGEKHPESPEVLELWSKAAASVKWWGESLRIAIRWASVEPGEASHLHLARTQRLVGQRYGAIQTLERFLTQAPESKPALVALEQYKNER